MKMKSLQKRWLPIIVVIFAVIITWGLIFSGINTEFALAFIAGLLGYTAIRIVLLYRDWPSQIRLSRITNAAAITAATIAWFDRILEPHIPLPRLSGWALEPETAGFLVRLITREKPKLIVEIGSGVSTLLMAYALKEREGCVIHSFDTNNRYAEKTRKLLKAHDLSDRAEVHYVPLEHIEIEEWEGSWLSSADFDFIDNNSIDILLVDGPPREICYHARYPAVPILEKKLGPGAIIVVDDTDCPEQAEIVRLWWNKGYFSAAPEFLPLGSGVALGWML